MARRRSRQRQTKTNVVPIAITVVLAILAVVGFVYVEKQGRSNLAKEALATIAEAEALDAKGKIGDAFLTAERARDLAQRSHKKSVLQKVVAKRNEIAAALDAFKKATLEKIDALCGQAEEGSFTVTLEGGSEVVVLSKKERPPRLGMKETFRISNQGDMTLVAVLVSGSITVPVKKRDKVTNRIVKLKNFPVKCYVRNGETSDMEAVIPLSGIRGEPGIVAGDIVAEFSYAAQVIIPEKSTADRFLKLVRDYKNVAKGELPARLKHYRSGYEEFVTKGR